MPSVRILGNFVLFQYGWFACVLSAAALAPWFGAVSAIAVAAIHLWLAPRPQAELALILAAVAIGTLWDSLLVALGWLRYPSGEITPWLAPYWIIALWALFATTLNVSLRWLRGRTALAAAFGAFGGPLAFYAGHRLGAVEIPDMATTLGVLALGWAVLTPALLAIARRLDGFTPAPEPVRVM